MDHVLFVIISTKTQTEKSLSIILTTTLWEQNTKHAPFSLLLSSPTTPSFFFFSYDQINHHLNRPIRDGRRRQHSDQSVEARLGKNHSITNASIASTLFRYCRDFSKLEAGMYYPRITSN